MVTMTDEYITSDTQCAAFLLTLGHRLLRVEGPGPRRCFVFVNVPAEAPASYYRDTAAVSPQALFAAYRELKRLVHQPT